MRKLERQVVALVEHTFRLELDLATSPKGRLGRPVEFGYIIDNEPLARGAVLGLTLETTRDQLTRALLEAAGNELAKITAALGERGLPAGEIEPRYSAQRRRYRELAPALTPFSRGLASSPTNPTRRTNTK